ncbi:MAG TPA: hypothetical protein VK812_04480 [Candidatus Binatus sp.]|nr:hypothetical protein [Candidatus Binatus sp.]
MSDEALDKQQQALLKSLAKKAVDFLVKISSLPEIGKEGYKVVRELDKAATVLEGAATGELISSDYTINQVAAVSKFLYTQTTSLARHDEGWWMENSKVNLLVSKETTVALHIFSEKRKLLLDLKETCDGVKDLALVAMTAANANVKGFAKLYIPSLVAVDGVVTKESRDRLDYAISAIDKIVELIEHVIRETADMQKAADRLMVLINSTDHGKGAAAIKGQ